MIHDISADFAGLVGFWCTTLLYGINIVVYFSCLYVLIKRRGDGVRIPLVLLGSATFQFVLSTMYTAIGLRMLIESFIWIKVPGKVLAYWLDPSSSVQIISKTVYITNTLVGDAILVWRLYVVWGNNWYICVLPAMMVIATAVTGYTTMGTLAHLSSEETLFLAGKWILAAWALSIATQVSVTSLIAGRIWWFSRAIAGATYTSAARYMAVIWIIVESGAIYSITTIFLLAFFDLKTQAGGVVGSCLAQICAIVPTLIIVRVGLGPSQNSTMRAGKKTGGSLSTPSTLCAAPGPVHTNRMESASETTVDDWGSNSNEVEKSV